MNMDDEKLLQYYLDLNGPDSGEWNSSPQCIHTQLVTRNYIKKTFDIFNGIQVCNVGIGTGNWDDYLGYWLKGRGRLTSIDLILMKVIVRYSSIDSRENSIRIHPRFYAKASSTLICHKQHLVL
ncbi:hypothetical protein D3C74_197450 [compost metagenome]